MQQSANARVKDFEKDIALFLINRLEDNSITEKRAAEIAFFMLLSVPPDMTDEQLARILPSLDDKFTELAELVNTQMKAIGTGEKEIVLSNLSDLVNHQQFSEAKTLISEYFNNKITHD